MKAPLAALLRLEWKAGTRCLVCSGARPVHTAACVLDRALSELGTITQDDREAARLRIEFTEMPTLPAPEDPPKGAS